MLSSVLNSERAVQVNIVIMRAFVRIRQMLAAHTQLAQKLTELERKLANHDQKIRSIFDAIRQLMAPSSPPRRRIGFHAAWPTMLARVETAAVVGLTAVPVTVEVDVSDGLPGMTIVGLPDATVKESKERIRSAVKNTQYAWPQTRATVNLAPADVRKEGSAFDLPMALGLLAASRQLGPEMFSDVVALGELALDGSLGWLRLFRGEGSASGPAGG